MLFEVPTLSHQCLGTDGSVGDNTTATRLGGAGRGGGRGKVKGRGGGGRTGLCGEQDRADQRGYGVPIGNS